MLSKLGGTYTGNDGWAEYVLYPSYVHWIVAYGKRGYYMSEAQQGGGALFAPNFSLRIL